MSGEDTMERFVLELSRKQAIIDALKSGKCQCDGAEADRDTDNYHLDSCPEMATRLHEGYCKRIKELLAEVKSIKDSSTDESIPFSERQFPTRQDMRRRITELEARVVELDNQQLYHGPIELRDVVVKLEAEVARRGETLAWADDKLCELRNEVARCTATWLPAQPRAA